MLTDGQIDYLLQIRKSKERIPNDTVRIMLKALSWSDSDIERGISFLGKQFSQTQPSFERPEKNVNENVTPPEQSPVNIKQHPFPVGSPYHSAIKQKTENVSRRHTAVGYIAGLVFFLVGIVVYVKYFASN